MNDLVRPTALFAGPRIPASGPAGVQGTVSNPPPQVAQLPAGTTLTGVVVGHDGEGHTLVRTDLGTLAVATKAQLPVNSEVTLQIRSTGGQLHVLIMHSEAQPGGTPGAPAGGPQAHTGAQAGGSGPRAAPTNAPTAAPTAAQAAHLPASDLLALGQSVRAVVQSPAAPTATGAGTGAGGSANTGAAGTGGQPAGPALTALAAQLAPGSELQLRIVTVQAPGPQSQAPATQAPGAQAPGAQAPGAQAPGAQTPGAQAPGTPVTAPGTAPGIAGQIATYGAMQGSAGSGVPATPSGPPNSATTTASPAPQPGAPAGAGQGAAAGPTAAPAPTPNTGGLGHKAPASGVAASYAAAGGVRNVAAGAAVRTAAIGATPNAPALLAAHGIGQGTTPSAPGALVQGAPALGGPAQGAPGSPPAATPTTAAPSSAVPAAAASNVGTGPIAAGQGAAGQGAAPLAAGAGGAVHFTGTVTAVTHAGRPVLQTPLGTLTLEIRAPLQVGSRIAFELPNTAALQPGSAGTAPAATGLSTLAHAWPALEEAFQVLHEVGVPGAAAAAIQEAIPQPGTRLASGLLFFLSALNGGDMTRWIGNQAIQALRTAGRDSLLSRLGRDFGQLSRLAENPGGDWRLFFIPLLDGDQIQQLRLFLRHDRHDGDGGGNGEDEEQTRFVVEVELNRLGDLQLDGLVRDKRLDLILRSRTPLPEFMRLDIMQIFHEANEITGYRGNIGFQSSGDWKAMPVEGPADAASAAVTV